MILVISGTNRPDSKTSVVSKKVFSLIRELYDGPVEYVSFMDLQQGLIHDKMYEGDKQPPHLKEAQDQKFIPADKWVLVTPEYNGSFPGVVKLVLDALSVRDADKTFHNKKVALVGISSGRAGNWLGMNQLTSILNYLKMNVYHNKLAISHISGIIDNDRQIVHPKTIDFMKQQLKGFLNF